MKIVFKIVFVLFSMGNAMAQYTVPLDTSYTSQSAFLKAQKKYPAVELVTLKERSKVNEQRDIVYKIIEGRALHLDAFSKSQKTIKPAIILVHGGGWKSGNRTMLQPLAQQLAEKGWVSFTVEYRLSLEAQFPEGIKDVKSAVKYVRKNAEDFGVDASKIAVLGCSSGAQMASLIAATNGNSEFDDVDYLPEISSNVEALINIDGILAFHHPKSEEGTLASEWLGGTYQERPEIWHQASALSHVSGNTTPSLFIKSDFDRFQAGREEFVAVLKQNNIYYDVKSIHNAPHTFWLFQPWFDEVLECVDQFLKTVFSNN